MTVIKLIYYGIFTMIGAGYLMREDGYYDHQLRLFLFGGGLILLVLYTAALAVFFILLTHFSKK